MLLSLHFQDVKTLCRSESTVENAEIARNARAQKDRETNCGLNVDRRAVDKSKKQKTGEISSR